jgi:hypothetical protein
MNYQTRAFLATLLGAVLALSFGKARADQSSEFEAEWFTSGTLVYSDHFDGEYDAERWGPLRKDRKIEQGKLIVMPRFESKEEAMRVLQRDHHLGLEPIIHLNKIPDKFVCHLRYKFDAKQITAGRPCFQIGHHMIVLSLLEGGGHQVKLPDGPVLQERESKVELGQWIEMVIEYRKGQILIDLNGHRRIYEDPAVTIENKNDLQGPRFSIKGGPDCLIVFDAVKLWAAE